MQAFLWEDFCRTLNADSLRRHLKALPDFEDIEAEDRAKAVARSHADWMLALCFFLDWPDHGEAARLIEARAADLDGDRYEVLTPAADALQGEHPLAATLARRAMILFALEKGRSKRYGHAARHLIDCAAADQDIPARAGNRYGKGPSRSSRSGHPRAGGEQTERLILP